eukprot:Seg1383.9 transcript_id=Seg1383.9/GoldUCD/mRNA.D3Y31 product="hypothetical protein" protein_id=Seg1383.9/GoldUCD/D3Y31
MDEAARLHYDDFLGLSLEELKFYLRQRGHIVSGSKKDLAARALICFESGDNPKNVGLLEKEAKEEYDALLQSFSLKDPLKETNWIDDIKQWPPVDIEIKCGFNDMSKKVIKGCKIMSMNIEKHAVGVVPKKQSLNSQVKKSFDPRKHANEIKQDSFFERLEEIKPTAGILLCVPKKVDDQCPPSLPEIAEAMANEVNTLPYANTCQIL